ncbi:hypothetical protein VNG72_21300 [Acidiphilium acidophilum]|nr:hypothetical protein [Acidiphilium acidophilum]
MAICSQPLDGYDDRRDHVLDPGGMMIAGLIGIRRDDQSAAERCRMLDQMAQRRDGAWPQPAGGSDMYRVRMI